MNAADDGSFEVSRLRVGETVAGLGGVLLLSRPGSALPPALRWLLRVTGLSGVALAYAQATRRAPALPAALSVVASALGVVSVVSLLVRALLKRPPSDGGVISLPAALTVAAGSVASLREESGADLSELGPLELIKLDS